MDNVQEMFLLMSDAYQQDLKADRASRGQSVFPPGSSSAPSHILHHPPSHDQVTALKIPIIKSVVEDRASVCKQMSVSTAVEYLTRALNGGRFLGSPEEEPQPLPALKAEGRVLRWLAVSQLPSVFADHMANQARKWPEATTLFEMWSAAEDQCLAAWEVFVRQSQCEHLSLHFDGLRVDKAGSAASPSFAQDASDFIHDHTGFRVTIVKKVHKTFLECIEVGATSTTERAPSHPQLGVDGNCIPAAWVRLRPELRDDVISTGGNVSRELRSRVQKSPQLTFLVCHGQFQVVAPVWPL